MNHIHLNSRLCSLKVSATIDINEKSKLRQQQNKPVYKLGFGQSPFPVPNTVVQALCEFAHYKDYLSPQGLPELCEAVSCFYQNENVDILSQNVMIGPGSKELMFLLQIALNLEVILVSPCWVSYFPQAHIMSKNISIIHTSYENKWRLKAQDLCDFCQKNPASSRLLILNYPGNPDSLTYNEQELQEIAQVAKRFNLIVLSDEIYSLLNFTGNHKSIFCYYPEGTIISSGLSKWCGAGGWRLGTFCFPPQLEALKKMMFSIASETFTSVSTPIQYAAVKAYQMNNEIKNYLFHSRKILKYLSFYCYQILINNGIRLHPSQGGFYLFLDFANFKNQLDSKEIRTSRDICLNLFESTGVALLPGDQFERPEQEMTARLSYVDFDGTIALQKSMELNVDVDLSNDFIEKYCKNTIDGVCKIVDWLT